MIWDLENKFVSILEYDKEWEEKKLRKAEYEAGKEDGKSEGITEIIQNMYRLGYSTEKIAEAVDKTLEEVEKYLQSNKQ